jgi:hypothetical protein
VDGGTNAIGMFNVAAEDRLLVVETLFTLSEATALAFFLGFAEVNAALLNASSGLNMVRAVGVWKPAGASKLYGLTREDSVSSLVELGTLVAGSAVDLQMRINGRRESVEWKVGATTTKESSVIRLPLSAEAMAASVALTQTGTASQTAKLAQFFAFQDKAAHV